MGFFVVLEGIDGVGTTTQGKLLTAWRRELGACRFTCEPTDGPVGRLIRRTLRAEEGAPDWRTLPWLFAADRADHLFGEIEPALERDEWVISDRYYHSSLAYQSLTLPLERVARLNDFRAPDITLVLQAPIDVCLDRIEKRGGVREIYEERERLERIHERYQAVIAFLRARGENIIEVDGHRPVDEVFEDLRLALEGLEGSPA